MLVPRRQDRDDGVVEGRADGTRRQVVAVLFVGYAELVIGLYLKRDDTIWSYEYSLQLRVSTYLPL